jgi:hypothetical protein
MRRRREAAGGNRRHWTNMGRGGNGWVDAAQGPTRHRLTCRGPKPNGLFLLLPDLSKSV